MMPPPKWAQSLLLDALVWWESQGNEAPNVFLVWRRRRVRCWRLYDADASGKANQNTGRILVIAGGNRLDAKLVLLHELAHQLVPKGHTPVFWETAWRLYRWAKLPLRYCQRREAMHYKGAAVAYRRRKLESLKGSQAPQV